MNKTMATGTRLYVYLNVTEVICGLVLSKFSHLITGSHLCVGLTLTSDNAEGLSQNDPGC